MAELYKKSGVDIHLADKFVDKIKAYVGETHNKSVIGGVGGFASLYQINSKQYLAASTDGVGTKVKLAQVLNKHDTIGQDLVAMCVNDLVCTGAQPLFFLDYFATGKLDLKVSVQVVKGIAKSCKSVGAALVGGETAEMPGIYAPGTYDLAGFSVGIVNKSDVLDGSRVKAGDILIGLASSGVHSNGFSLVRKIFETHEAKWLRLAFTPTRLYVQSVLGLLNKFKKEIRGAAHITGSGFLNIARIHPGFDYHVTDLPKTPLIFAEILRRTGMGTVEAYTTFNMGIGMVLAVSPKSADLVLKYLKSKKEKASILGYVAKGKGQVFVSGLNLEG